MLWTESLIIAGRSQLWPLAAEARYGDLGTGHTAPVSQALGVEQRVADEDVLKADDVRDEKANSMVLSFSPAASQDAMLPHVVIVHTACLYWDCPNVSHQPGQWLQPLLVIAHA